MVKWFIHRFPKLAKLVPLLRFLEIIDMAISFYYRLPSSVKLGVNIMVVAIAAKLALLRAVVWSLLEPNLLGFVLSKESSWTLIPLTRKV